MSVCCIYTQLPGGGAREHFPFPPSHLLFSELIPSQGVQEWLCPGLLFCLPFQLFTSVPLLGSLTSSRLFFLKPLVQILRCSVPSGLSHNEAKEGIKENGIAQPNPRGIQPRDLSSRKSLCEFLTYCVPSLQYLQNNRPKDLSNLLGKWHFSQSANIRFISFPISRLRTTIQLKL